MSEVLKQPAALGAPEINLKSAGLASYLPAAVALLGAVALMLLRMQVGPAGLVRSDGGLMLFALAAYLIAAVFYLTNLYAPSRLFEKIGITTATVGVMLNLGSWLVRWIAYREHDVAIWLQQGKAQAEWPWFFRNIPFANLYDLSLAFAFGAGITTLLIAHRKNFRFLGAISLPLASLILILARFIGDDIGGLQPVLDSYWRPIHVGIASLSYGIALVCFATAVVYLLKDGVKTEAMAVWSSVFSLLVIATVSKGSVLAVGSVFWGLSGTVGSYGTAVFLPPRFPMPLRAELPYVGWLLLASGLLLAGVVALFLRYLYGGDERARRLGHHVLKAALLTQALAVCVLVYQVKSIQSVAVCEDGAARAAATACIYPSQFQRAGSFLAEQQGARPEQVAAIPADVLAREGGEFLKERQSQFFLSLNANPVELAALITAFAGTLFVILFSFKTERLRAALPDREKIDSLMYKTGGVTFAGLALLLMTGAVWANESWGRYWGWDSKETGAFVAWLTYGGFLHVRISRGWSGRASAYFAIVAFLLIVFTYLGVSYLLPGLHSYA
ncbi:MAG TPA: cytochrome c biogenesis protein CcsA [Pyrinomonadaceae bacterium]|jgi:ABC-type transport system involved in cytochrome c biogenesis permease subunit